ncbi:MAG TPA: protein-glutamate O-methyltransferase CheR [Gemmatimonadales bacterium]|nr:protein-glutamate O-methyltransferase CheR [Gemmatimonadales bacterium]
MTTREDAGLAAVIDQLAMSGAAGFEWYKDSCLVRRIEVRMRALRAESLLAYAAMLREDPGEVDRLLHTISVRVTGFFRNPDSWQRLRDVLETDRTGSATGTLTAWSMACATGEEAWTLAMLLTDHALRQGEIPRARIRIHASDVDSQAIVQAETGRYLPPAAVAIREVMPRNHGSIHDGCFEVEPELRPLLTFRREDLTTVTTPPSPCDLICCRNVLIFLGREGQRRVLDTAFRALAPGGLLMLGRTESLVALPEPRLVPVDISHRIYRRAS